MTGSAHSPAGPTLQQAPEIHGKTTLLGRHVGSTTARVFGLQPGYTVLRQQCYEAAVYVRGSQLVNPAALMFNPQTVRPLTE